MIESPLIQELMAQRMHKDIARVLATRFVYVPPEVLKSLGTVQDEGRLTQLIEWAVHCPDIEAFRKRLRAGANPVMFESSQVQVILRFLAARLGPLPGDIAVALQEIQDEAKLDELVHWAAQCADLEAFRQRVRS